MDVIQVGKGNFTVDKYKFFRTIIHLGLIEVQWKDDGVVNDTPSMIFIMKDRKTNLCVSELSLETL